MGSSSQSYVGNKGTLDNIINNNNDDNNKRSCKHRWKRNLAQLPFKEHGVGWAGDSES